jgi:hypothetical protein
MLQPRRGRVEGKQPIVVLQVLNKLQKIQGGTLKVPQMCECRAVRNEVPPALDSSRLAVAAIEVSLNVKMHLEHPVGGVIQDGVTHLHT